MGTFPSKMAFPFVSASLSSLFQRVGNALRLPYLRACASSCSPHCCSTQCIWLFNAEAVRWRAESCAVQPSAFGGGGWGCVEAAGTSNCDHTARTPFEFHQVFQAQTCSLARLQIILDYRLHGSALSLRTITTSAESHLSVNMHFSSPRSS